MTPYDLHWSMLAQFSSTAQCSTHPRSPLRHVLRTAGIHQGKLAAVAGPVRDNKKTLQTVACKPGTSREAESQWNDELFRGSTKMYKGWPLCARGCLYHSTDFDDWAMAPDNKQCRMLKRQEKMAVQSLKGPWVAPEAWSSSYLKSWHRHCAMENPEIDCWSLAMDQNQMYPIEMLSLTNFWVGDPKPKSCRMAASRMALLQSEFRDANKDWTPR